MKNQPSAESKCNVQIDRYRTLRPVAKAKIILPRYMITFLLEGEKNIHFAGQRVTVKPHQFIMLAPGNCLMTEKLAIKGDYHSLMCFFDSEWLDGFFRRHPDLLPEKNEQADDVPFLLFEKDEFLSNYISSLHSLVASGNNNDALKKTKLDELFLYLFSCYRDQISLIRQITFKVEGEMTIRNAVTSHIDHNITVEELAFLCNMSLSTFKRRFAKVYGTSPSKWIIQKRMEKAATLLRHEKRNPSEIYYECGYENLSSFIQSFKQVYGVTPKQYQLTN